MLNSILSLAVFIYSQHFFKLAIFANNLIKLSIYDFLTFII